MSRFLFCVLLLAAVTCQAIAAEPPAKEPKVLCYVVTSPTCAPCQKLKAELIANMPADLVRGKHWGFIDATEARKYWEFRSVPTVIYADPFGKELDRFTGYQRVERIVSQYRRLAK